MAKKFLISIFSLLLLLVNPNWTLAQKPIDKAIELEIKSYKTDTAKLNYLNKKGEDYLNEGNFERANQYLNQALNISKKGNLDKKTVIIYQNIGNVFSDMGNNNEAVKYYNEALEISKKINHKIGIAQTLNLIGIAMYNQGKNVEALEYYEKALALNLSLNNKADILKNYTNLGNLYEDQGNKLKALLSFEASLKIARQLKDNKSISRNLNNISICYLGQGNYTVSLNYLLSSLKINETIGDKSQIASNYMNIGLIYYYQKNYEEALKWQFKSMAMHKELASKRDIASNLNNLSSIYFDIANYNLALNYENEALLINLEIDNKNGIAKNYKNIGNIYLKQSQFDKAFENFYAGLKIDKELNDQEGISVGYCNIAETFIQLKKYKEARDLILKSLPPTIASANKFRIKEHYFVLAKLDSIQGIWRGAYFNYRLFDSYGDSLINERNTKKLVESQMQYEFDKKQNAEKLKQETKDAIVRQEKKRQRIITFSVSIGLALVLIFSLLIFNRFRVTLKQKKIIEIQKKKVENQKELIEEKNKQVTDSINYAKRIQTAILPPIGTFKKKLPNSFIFYLPKDIVAGDFYWQEKIGDQVLFAACDCTGHGVPGAMVSVVCNNALNRAVREFNKIKPAEILDKTLEIVIENFDNSEDEIKDGMDIALCSFNPSTNQLEYAGANNPLWIIRNNEFIEIKADKQAIGNVDNIKPYTNHVIQLAHGDKVYISSDGYSDQFGGETGKKKLTKKRFKELLLSINNQSIEDQGKKLETFFFEYKKDIDQIDDILVIGFMA
jgi:tetratricopeptide (TPR) repeat protein/serine phosphatase RsbU (regulator of sigma subunit)